MLNMRLVGWDGGVCNPRLELREAFWRNDRTLTEDLILGTDTRFCIGAGHSKDLFRGTRCRGIWECVIKKRNRDAIKRQKAWYNRIP